MRGGAWMAAALALAGGLATGARGAPVAVVAASGTLSPAGLPYSRFVSVALGDGGHLAVLAATTGVFRAVHEGGVARAVRVFGPGDVVDGRSVIGADAPAQTVAGCVAARLAFGDGTAGVYRRCGEAVERVAGVGDLVDGVPLASVDAAVAATGPYVAFPARYPDGNTVIVRGGTGSVSAIVRTGQGSPAGGTFSSVRLVGVRADGTIGFGATVVGGSDGLFEGDGGAVRKVAVEGDEVPVVIDGEEFFAPLEAIDGAAVNAAGIFVFVGGLDDDARTRGVFRADARSTPADVTLEVRVGDPAPGVEGGTFSRFQTSAIPVINAAGDVAFRVTLGGDVSGAGIFVARAGGDVEQVVTTRDEVKVAPPAGEAVKKTLTRLRDPALADDGSVVVVSTPPGEGVGLFEARAGAIAELIRFGAPADLGTESQRFRFVQPSAAATAAGAVFLGQHEALLAVDPAGAVRLVTQLGAATGVGGIFSEIDLPGIGIDGRVAFRGEVLDGKTGQAIFAESRGRVKAIAKAGRPAPGPGRYRDFPATVSDSSPSVEVAGSQIGFLASLFDSNAFEGIFLRGASGSGGKALARTNARAPGGGEYVSVDVPSVLDRKHYAFTGLVRDDATRQGIFWRDGAKTRIVARQGIESGTRIGGRFQAFAAPDVGALGLLFRGQLSPVGLDGLFLAVGTRRGLLVAAGDTSDRGDVFRAFDRPAWSGDAVAFSASLAGVPSLRGLFALTPDGLPAPDAPQRPVTTVLREGDDAPGGGRIADVRPPVGNSAGTVASVVRVEGGPAEQIVVRIAPDSPPSP